MGPAIENDTINKNVTAARKIAQVFDTTGCLSKLAVSPVSAFFSFSIIFPLFFISYSFSRLP